MYVSICLLCFVQEIASDVRLVWSNCKLYNRDGSEVRVAQHHAYLSHILFNLHVFSQFYFLADKFSKDFESAYTALQKFGKSFFLIIRIVAVVVA